MKKRDLKIFFNEHCEKCMICNNPFNAKGKFLIGKNKENQLLVTCENCTGNLDKIIVEDIIPKHEFVKPPKDSILWRYMDFGKLLSMIINKSLFFSNLNSLEDPFEGAAGAHDVLNTYSHLALLTTMYRLTLSLPANKSIIPMDTDTLDKVDELYKRVKGKKATDTDLQIYNSSVKILSKIERARVKSRNSTFVNCWHENSTESTAMWALYSKDVTNALAINTTYEDLYYSLDRDPEIQIGRINYDKYGWLDYHLEGPEWFKRIAFSHENEVRCVIKRPNSIKSSVIKIPVDTHRLIKKIVISPYAEDWFSKVVAEIIGKYEFDPKIITKSDLSRKPFY